MAKRGSIKPQVAFRARMARKSVPVRELEPHADYSTSVLCSWGGLGLPASMDAVSRPVARKLAKEAEALIRGFCELLAMARCAPRVSVCPRCQGWIGTPPPGLTGLCVCEQRKQQAAVREQLRGEISHRAGHARGELHSLVADMVTAFGAGEVTWALGVVLEDLYAGRQGDSLEQAARMVQNAWAIGWGERERFNARLEQARRLSNDPEAFAAAFGLEITERTEHGFAARPKAR